MVTLAFDELITWSTHFMPLDVFYTSLKYQKIRGFLIFSGGIEKDQWHEID